MLEAVGGRLVAAVSVILPSFTQKKSPFIQEEVSLHWFEASQLLHPCGTSFVADPHAKRALHKHTAQFTDFPLHVEREGLQTFGDICGSHLLRMNYSVGIRT